MHPLFSMLYFVPSRGHPLLPLSFFFSESTALVASWYVQIIFAIHEFIFSSLRAGGILQILQSRLLFVNEQNPWFLIIFLLKLALLLALAREKWILLFRQKIWRENKASRPGKPLKWSKTGGSWCRFTSFINYAVSTAILPLCTVYSTFLLCL